VLARLGVQKLRSVDREEYLAAPVQPVELEEAKIGWPLGSGFRQLYWQP
jgi:hypothetical protein